MPSSPYDDYQKLLADAEMLADVIAYDATRKALAGNGEELIPAGWSSVSSTATTRSASGASFAA